MEIYLPKNVFTETIVKSLSGLPVNFSPAAVIIKKIKETPDAVGFIPVTDLINNRELFVSKANGISFEGSLCNTYIYYPSSSKSGLESHEKNEFKEINLFGDISTVEAILGKILFKEIYNKEVEVKILKDLGTVGDGSTIITGDENFRNERFKSGISFSEIIEDTLNIPYVNYIIASTKKELVEQVNEKFVGIDDLVYNSMEIRDFGKSLSDASKNYIIENVSSFIMRFEESDIEGINQLIKLPYYHGMIDDIFDINFV
jgi:hypothetical protein